MDIALEHRARCAVFCDKILTAVEQPLLVAAAVFDLVETPKRIIAQVCGVRTARAYKAVLGVVDIGRCAIRGQVSVVVVAVGVGVDAVVLVETIGIIGNIETAAWLTIPNIGLVAGILRRGLARLIVGIVEIDVPSVVNRIVDRDGLKPLRRIVGIAAVDSYRLSKKTSAAKNARKANMTGV